MTKHQIITLELNFQGIHGAISSYLIPYKNKAVLVECGPGSTLPALKEQLADYGLMPTDISHVLLTHIHLDHAGAAGWWAQQGAQILVHHIGAPHLIQPDRLIKSATRIYGDQMETLWGDFLPVPADSIHPLHDQEQIVIDNLNFTAVDTPGHANHHMAYILDDTCFSGDVGGVRMDIAGTKQLRLPTPPPEFHLEKWKQSIEKLSNISPKRMALTHFGIFDDAEWHLEEVKRRLLQLESFLREVIPSNPEQERFREIYEQWLMNDYKQSGIEPKWVVPLTAVNPTDMSADGLFRYWKKYLTT